MNMDKLEQFVRDNREAFDDEVPSLNVWAGIDQQLAKKQTRIVSFHRMLRVAAAVILLLGVGTVFGTYLAKGEASSVDALALQVSPELDKIEKYYEKQIENKYQQLASYKHDQSIETDLDQLDETMEELKQELLTAPKGKEEQILQSLIQGYQTKIEILELVLQRIQSTNQDQSKPEENEISI